MRLRMWFSKVRNRNFLGDRRGILLVWMVTIIAICVCAMMWVLSAVVLGLFGDAFFKVTSDPHAVSLWNSLQYSSGFVLVILLVGSLAYALVSSFKKEDEFNMGRMP
jgi:ABC-type sulfate transport system permease component